MQIKSNEIVIEAIEKLTSDPKNENIHSEKQIEVLQKIIEINGFRNPLTVSNRSGYVICGNGRLEAARKMGMDKLPVIYQDFENEAEETRHRLADNEIARHAELDRDKMLENLKDLDIDLQDFDFEEVGLIDFDFSKIGDSENNEIKDLSDDDTLVFAVEVRLTNEMEQQDLYDDLVSKGYTCKVLSI